MGQVGFPGPHTIAVIGLTLHSLHPGYAKGGYLPRRACSASWLCLAMISRTRALDDENVSIRRRRMRAYKIRGLLMGRSAVMYLTAN